MIIVLLFEVVCGMNINQRSAEKKSVYSSKVESIDKSLSLASRAVKQNKRNPLYQLNMCCLYAMADSLDSDLFSMMFQDKEIIVSHVNSLSELLKELYTTHPCEPIFSLNYSLSLILVGDYSNALDILMPFANGENSTREILLVSGLLSEKQERKEDALKYYSKAISQYGDIIESRFYINLKQRNPDLARQSFFNAIDSLRMNYENSHNPMIAALLGKLYYNSGDIGKAEQLLKYALEELPTLNRTWYYLGCIEEKRGKKGTSLEYYKKSYELDETDILPLTKMAEYDDLLKDRLSFLKLYSVSYQTYRLKKVYGGQSINYPYIISDLEKYFSPYISD